MMSMEFKIKSYCTQRSVGKAGEARTSRVLVILIILFSLLQSFSINAAMGDVLPKNPQLTSISTEVQTIKRGEVFTLTIGVNAFNGYVYYAGAHFFTTNSATQTNTSFDCIGYMPINGDSSRVLLVQNGKIELRCMVPRSALEGNYRLYYLDLSSVGCKKTYVMEVSNPAGVSCPNSWTHYAYKTGAFDKLSDPYATENQINSLGYPVEIFTNAPAFTVRGILPLEFPEIKLIKSEATGILAEYYFGSANMRDMTGLCAVSADHGELTTNWELTPPSLPLNGAAQPTYYENVKIRVTKLDPNKLVNLELSCKSSSGEIASKVFQFKTLLPEPPKIPIFKIESITDQSANLIILNYSKDDRRYEYILNGVTQDLNANSLTLTGLKTNSTVSLKIRVIDIYDQKTDSPTQFFRTLRVTTSIICSKGKVKKKLTAFNPKCPPGYKQS